MICDTFVIHAISFPDNTNTGGSKYVSDKLFMHPDTESAISLEYRERYNCVTVIKPIRPALIASRSDNECHRGRVIGIRNV